MSDKTMTQEEKETTCFFSGDTLEADFSGWSIADEDRYQQELDTNQVALPEQRQRADAKECVEGSAAGAFYTMMREAVEQAKVAGIEYEEANCALYAEWRRL